MMLRNGQPLEVGHWCVIEMRTRLSLERFEGLLFISELVRFLSRGTAVPAFTAGLCD